MVMDPIEVQSTAYCPPGRLESQDSCSSLHAVLKEEEEETKSTATSSETVPELGPEEHHTGVFLKAGALAMAGILLIPTVMRLLDVFF